MEEVEKFGQRIFTLIDKKIKVDQYGTEIMKKIESPKISTFCQEYCANFEGGCDFCQCYRSQGVCAVFKEV